MQMKLSMADGKTVQVWGTVKKHKNMAVKSLKKSRTEVLWTDRESSLRKKNMAFTSQHKGFAVVNKQGPGTCIPSPSVRCWPCLQSSAIWSQFKRLWTCIKHGSLQFCQQFCRTLEMKTKINDQGSDFGYADL